MSHLSAERIAALVDESPTAAELSHLAVCGDCARERVRYVSLVALAKDAPVIGIPITSWDRLAPALQAEGLMLGGASRAQIATRPNRRWMQVAAAAMLVVGGGLAGRATAGVKLVPTSLADVGVGRSAMVSAPSFASVQDAMEAQAQAQQISEAASTYLASLGSGVEANASPRTLRARLAGLDQTIDMLNEALRETPNDPAIVSNRQATLSQYNETMRQLTTARPVSLTMAAY